MPWALIEAGVVGQIEDADPGGRYHPALVWMPAPAGTREGDTWDGARFARPAPPDPSPPAPPPPPRVVSAPEFLALFTPDEAAAMWAADPALMFGAMLVLAQGTANLDSPDLANLLGLAVAKGTLTPARAARVAAGLPPEAPGEAAPVDGEPVDPPGPPASDADPA